MYTYMLGLGTNLGNRYKNIQTCHKYLKEIGIIKKRSTLYETEPFGVKEQPLFLNQVVHFTTKLSPEEVFRKIKTIEKKMKRMPTIRNGQRIIDIDLLWCKEYKGTFIIQNNEVTIPHKEMQSREETVLKPLREITSEEEYKEIVSR